LTIEVYKIFKRSRTYLSFAFIAIIVSLFQIAFYAGGDEVIELVLQSVNHTLVIEGSVLNGYLVCFIILQTLFLHVPLLIALIAGDMIAGEASMGTLRLLITKPSGRSQVLISKFIASLLYTVILLAFLAILTLPVSILVFGTGDLIIFKNEMIVILDNSDVLWRYFCAFGFTAIAMITVNALALLFSVFAENSIGPIVATVSIIIILNILSTMDIPIFNTIKPYLFTYHMLNWKGFFENPIDFTEVTKSALILLTYVIFFVSLAIVCFRKKDILS
jgi:ABC-2 type transport system permease protein